MTLITEILAKKKKIENYCLIPDVTYIYTRVVGPFIFSRTDVAYLYIAEVNEPR